MHTPPRKLELLASTVLHFPETGAALHRYVYYSRTSGQVAQCDIDDGGFQADVHAMAEQERLARIAHHGRIDRTLETIADAMGPDDRRWVYAWVPIPDWTGGAGSNLLRDPAAAAEERARVNSIVSSAIPRILATLPANTPYVWPGHGSPFVRLRLGPAEITALAHSDLVGNLYDGENTVKIPLADVCDANQYFLTNTDQVHQTPYSLDGSGVKIATFESVCANKYLPFDPSDPAHSYSPQSSCADPNNHGGEVLGYIANTSPYDPEASPPDPVLRGFAPKVELFSANAPSDVDGFAWAAGKGIAIGNFSYYVALNPNVCPYTQSLTNTLSDYYATHPPFILSVAGTGNHDPFPGTCVSNKVLNILHNGLVVGAAFPHQVYSCNPTCSYVYAKSYDRSLDWSRQTATGDYFVWKNPDPGAIYLGVGDLELPHIVAYNRMQGSIDDSVYCEASGTSFSTPQVTGAAALVSQENPALYGRPEALRAVLMAGADVNTDLNTPGLGSSYSYYPLYDNLGFGGTTDRHGGAGLLNTLASVQIAAPSARLTQDNRLGLAFSKALANTSLPIQAYQALINATVGPGSNGHDYGVMDPDADFDTIWYKHFYYFTSASSGYLRIVLAWNRPYTCTFGAATSCGPDWKPDLNMLLRDLGNPTGAVQTAHSWDPDQEVIAAPISAGVFYRLDIYKQNYWPGPESFALATYFTTNSQ